ncbi:MAG: hypothetical protein LR015_11395 [Verrucomicrobia bacterium]|nr:hypothetical protein [Verrucomicrobiota bacterium]
MSTESISLIETFHSQGQGHVFAFWEGLTEEQRQHLLRQAAEIDLIELENLVQHLVIDSGHAGADLEGLAPAPYLADPERGGESP